ncbi:hypothetical protein MYX82_04870 [Acidobacteria bacterium AH-259-D05]|nr:hypothetical protein [Acidobacteria bacterium AH-259-D05]
MYVKGDASNTKLILCEGQHDVHFFKALLQVRNIIGYRIACGEIKAEGSGIDSFGECLNAIDAGTDFDNVKQLLIVADNDTDPEKQLKKVKNQIRCATGFGVPARPLRSKKSKDRLPRVTIMMLPWSTDEGCLETLLLGSTYKKGGISLKTSVLKYCKETKAEKWPLPKFSKLQIRIMLSTMWKKDPYLSLAYAWSSDPSRLIPLDHPSLDKIVRFLERF